MREDPQHRRCFHARVAGQPTAEGHPRRIRCGGHPSAEFQRTPSGFVLGQRHRRRMMWWLCSSIKYSHYRCGLVSVEKTSNPGSVQTSEAPREDLVEIGTGQLIESRPHHRDNQQSCKGHLLPYHGSALPRKYPAHFRDHLPVDQAVPYRSKRSGWSESPRASSPNVGEGPWRDP